MTLIQTQIGQSSSTIAGVYTLINQEGVAYVNDATYRFEVHVQFHDQTTH